MQAIARAIYSKREFLIFDDVLSGLDAGTENKVFNRVFGKEGLIRSSNMTIVAAASSSKLTCCRHDNCRAKLICH